MTQSLPFKCPNCSALYEVVPVEADSDSSREIACLACGAPLIARDGKLALKYFLLLSFCGARANPAGTNTASYDCHELVQDADVFPRTPEPRCCPRRGYFVSKERTPPSRAVDFDVGRIAVANTDDTGNAISSVWTGP